MITFAQVFNNSFMVIKSVIFDQDGTVADTLPLIANAVRNTLVLLSGKDVPIEKIVAFFGPSEDGVMRKMFPEQPQKAFEIYLEQYNEIHDEICPAPFSGVKDLVRTISSNGVSVSMVTGKCRQATEISLKKFGLYDYFEYLETGSPEGSDKVNGIGRVIKKLGIDKSECLYVGDEPSDIRLCRSAGIPIASAAWASTAQPDILSEMNPGMVFNTIGDFKKWFMRNQESL